MPKEKIEEINKEKTKQTLQLLVVNELPKEDIRVLTDDSGEQYECVTVIEAVQEILIKIRDIHKKL